MAGITDLTLSESMFTSAVRRALWWVRQLSGDSAYDNYLRCVCQVAAHAPEPRTAPKPLSRKEFYLDSVRRRYSTPSRCC